MSKRRVRLLVDNDDDDKDNRALSNSALSLRTITTAPATTGHFPILSSGGFYGDDIGGTLQWCSEDAYVVTTHARGERKERKRETKTTLVKVHQKGRPLVIDFVAGPRLR